MGFLERILRKGISDGVSKAVGDAISKAIKPSVTEFANKTAQQFDDAARNAQSSQAYASAPFVQKTYNTDDNYFASVITEASFPGYSISTNVLAKNFDASAHPSCYPISYLFSNGSQPKLAVLVMNKNQYRSMIAKGTYKVLDDNGIPYIRFFKGMENESGYVINRIRENLR